MTNPEPSDRISKKQMITLIIVIALAVILCAVAVISVIHTIRNDNPTEPTEPTVDTQALAEAAKNTVALTIGDHELNAVELNYFYMETVNQFVNDYYQYIIYGMIPLDTTKPLNEQYFDETTKVTWADYFMDIAHENIKSTYLLCDLAEDAGFTLSEDELAYLDSLSASIESYAVKYGFESADAYVVDIFGYGAEMESYLDYFERALLADAYYTYYAESLEFTDEEVREFVSGSEHEYSAFSYSVYTLATSKFLTGGTEDSDGKITYTDEQIAASILAAEEAANTLNGAAFETIDLFKEGILGLEINSTLDSVVVKEYSEVAYSNISAAFQDWIISADRFVGEVGVIPQIVTTGEGEDAKETIEGYYIIRFDGVNDNNILMKNVRHILVLFKNDEGKTYSDGITSFTEQQKTTALETAEALLAQWQAGEATEDSFAALATEKTEDGGSKTTGGLYENIYPGQMVENFEAWCFDESRQYGDTGLVESVYGYHIMFFVGNTEQTYREFMITYTMRSEKLTEWHNSLVESAVLTELCLDYCPLDYTISG